MSHPSSLARRDPWRTKSACSASLRPAAGDRRRPQAAPVGHAARTLGPAADGVTLLRAAGGAAQRSSTPTRPGPGLPARSRASWEGRRWQSTFTTSFGEIACRGWSRRNRRDRRCRPRQLDATSGQRLASARAQVLVVDNPVDLERFDPARADGPRARGARAPTRATRCSLLVGQLTPWKGQETAIRRWRAPGPPPGGPPGHRRRAGLRRGGYAFDNSPTGRALTARP